VPPDEAFSDKYAIAGGFDVVIGNPPWISLKGKFRNEICSNAEINYLTSKYHGDTYRPNIYEYFVKRALMLAKEDGYHSFIVPDRLGLNQQFRSFRKKLIKEITLNILLYKVDFPNVIVDTLIYVCKKQIPSDDTVVEIGYYNSKMWHMKQKRFGQIQDCQFIPITDIIKKLYFMSKNTKAISDIVSSNVGFIAKSKTITKEIKTKEDIPIIRGRNVFRYFSQGQAYFRFKKSNLAGGTQDIDKLAASEKVLIRKTGFPLLSTFDDSGRYPEQSLYFLFNPLEGYNLKYILGILNSKLFQYVYWNWMVTNRESTPQLKKIHLDKFPIASCDFSNPDDVKKHDLMVKLVDEMLVLHKKLHETTDEKMKRIIQKQIEITDKKIDALVYELYGLTEEEIKVVEEG